MQTTFTSTVIKNQSNDAEITQKLDDVIVLHNLIERKLYTEIQQYYKINNTSKLPNNKINQLKSTYQKKYHINARQYNSIESTLMGKISSILESNKGYLEETQDKIKSLEKSMKSKQKNLDILLKKKELSKIEQFNLANLKTKLYYLNKKLDKANHKLKQLTHIEKTGNSQLCFGSNKLFRQQFEIEKANNLTQFKTHAQWKKAWIESRNKTFFLVGSSDETAGNSNCQIKHIEKDIYELKVNINPNAVKLKDRYISIRIQLHNDKNNLIKKTIENNLGQDKSKYQALSYRFYKDYKNDTYKVFISLDKSKQQPKIISHKQLGTIGIDINAQHLSISEIDRFGNLLKVQDFILDLKDKTSNQSLDKIACAVKEITDYAKLKNKPIVIEKLDFSQKKKELKSGFNKKYNAMLSSFAYSKIIELIKSRSFDKGIEVIEVNPAYTSKIGKFKYQNQYKLTTHQAAAFVIARRGLLSYTKKINVKYDRKNTEGNIVESVFKRKEILVINKEKTISSQLSKHYPFDLPVRNNQKQECVYWNEIEQNYLKAKKHKINLKRKKLIMGKDSSSSLPSETTLVADNFGSNPRANRCSKPRSMAPF